MNPKDYKPRVGLWSQRDIRWSWKRLGTSGAKMGPKGCAVTCLAYIVLRYYYDIEKNPGMYYRPGEVCDKAVFTPQGDVYLNTVDRLTGGKLLNSFSPDNARYTMIMVTWAGQTHWVVKVGGDNTLCFDPWVGDIVPLHQSKWIVTDKQRWFRLK